VKVVVTVDPGLCMGIRSCVRAAPSTFYVEENQAHGIESPGDDLHDIIEAAIACPNFAITVEVDGEVVFDPEQP
jgi:ferredoxin